MKAVYSAAALSDLDEILGHTREHFPGQSRALEQRLLSVIARVEARPQSARMVMGRPGIRIVPLLRYPFNVFYRVDGDRLTILRIMHSARSSPV